MQKVGNGVARLAGRRRSAQWPGFGGGAAAGAAVRRRAFHASWRLDIVKPFILADIGEGIKEVQIIQWFVQPGARVEQFDKICEVQSDKASVEITSRFDGVIKKLHYDADAMAQVGKPLLDIDITGDIAPQDEKLLEPDNDSAPASEDKGSLSSETSAPPPQSSPPTASNAANNGSQNTASSSTKSSSLATPAVRGLLKELKLNIEDIRGTGRDGRVMKEDVHAHVAAQRSPETSSSSPTTPASSTSSTPPPTASTPSSAAAPSRPPARTPTTTQQETPQALTAIQAAMFRSMTKSLSIPHFLCADEVDLTALGTLRRDLNAQAEARGTPRLSALPFIVKAVSMALETHPILNARLDTSASPARLVHRSVHNIGVAMDTPQGLLVPNIKDVANLSIREIGTALAALAQRAQAGKLTPDDLKGGTITVSNIGSIGGSYATPLLVEGELAIVAVGRVRTVPAFDDAGDVVPKDMAALSWSADHRVIDGATLARMGSLVKTLLEGPAGMMVGLR